jgi:hypothetical protein
MTTDARRVGVGGAVCDGFRVPFVHPELAIAQNFHVFRSIEGNP